MEENPPSTTHQIIQPEFIQAEQGNYLPRNFALGVVNGILYIFAETVFDPTLVLVAFLSNLTSSPLLLGAILPLRDGTWSLPQLWVTGYLQNKAQKLPLYNLMIVIRASMWAFIFASITFVRDPTLLLILFFLFYSVGSTASGVSGLAFLEVVGRTIEPRRRGEFYAWRLGMGGLVGIAGSLLVRYLLDPHPSIQFPLNFSILSGLYFLFGSAALILFSFVKEGHGYKVIPKATTREQLHRIRQILRTNAFFRSYLIMQGTLVVANAATPFFALYGIQKLGIAKDMVAIYLAAVTAANLLANLVFGRMSLIHGNRRVMTIATITGLAMSGLVFLMVVLNPIYHFSVGVASIWLVPVFVLSGFRTTGIGVSGNSLLLDLAPTEERTLYIGFTNTLMGIILLLTALSGIVYMIFGFPILLIVTLVAHGIALIYSRRVNSFPAK